MKLTAMTLLFILAIICFVLAAFRVKAVVDWTNLGFAFVVAAWVVPT